MWRTLMNAKTDIIVTAEIARTCHSLTRDELAAYDIPCKATNGLFGARHFHDTIILDEDDPDYALVESGHRWLREEWTGRNYVLAGTKDPLFSAEPAKEFCSQIGCSKSVILLQDVCGHPFEQQPGCIDLVINELFAAR